MNSNIAPDPPHFARVGSVHGAPFRSDQSAPRGRPSFARRSLFVIILLSLGTVRAIAESRFMRECAYPSGPEVTEMGLG